MATDVDKAYYGWSQEELSDGDDSQEVSVSQMLDHGSISFGRFAVESLSWERRSVFTHNRRLEELEKFNGLVAKKKAYFEERYRRIRALKASQQNQQTELTLDYGADGSISSQTGEEDETASRHESPKDGNITNDPSEEITVGATIEQEISCNEYLQGRSFNPESTSPDIAFSRGNSERIEQDKIPDGAMEVQPFEKECSLPLTGELDKNRRLEDKELKHENLISNAESRVISFGSALAIKNTKYNESKPIKKSLDSKSALSIKDSAAAVRTSQFLKQETKSNAVNPSKGAKIPSQKVMGKAESSKISSNRTVHQVSNNTRSTLVPSNKLLTEACFSITTPGPFTLAMESRANYRTCAAKLDLRSSKKPASSLSHAKDGLSVQDMLKKKDTIVGTKNRRGLENRRELRESTKKPLTLDSRHTSLRRTETHVLGPTKPRSIIPPVRSKSNSTVATASQLTAVKGTKLKERKEDNRLMVSQRVTVKTSDPSMNANTKMGTKKSSQARPMDQFHSGRKQRINNLPIDGRKTRPETPHWR